MMTALIVIGLLVATFVGFVLGQDVVYFFLGHESRFSELVHAIRLWRLRRTAIRTGLRVLVREQGDE